MHTSTKSSMSLTLRIFLTVLLMHSSIAFCASVLKGSAAEKEKEACAQQCGIALSFENAATEEYVKDGAAILDTILYLSTPQGLSCLTVNTTENVLFLSGDKKTGFHKFVVSCEPSLPKNASVGDLKPNILYTLHLHYREKNGLTITSYSTTPLDYSSLSSSNEKTAAQAAKASAAIAKNSATTPVASSSSSGAVAAKSTSTQT
jgi:hypothetical protein